MLVYSSCRLSVTIEREIAPKERGILFFLMVTEDFTIEQLQLMVCVALNRIEFDQLIFLYTD